MKIEHNLVAYVTIPESVMDEIAYVGWGDGEGCICASRQDVKNFLNGHCDLPEETSMLLKSVLRKAKPSVNDIIFSVQ